MRFVARSIIATSAERLFTFHELPDALSRLTPPGVYSRVIAMPESLEVGERAVVEIRVAPLVWVRTELVHTLYEPPFRFRDEQVRGPFRRWRHDHLFTPRGDGTTELTDDIDFEPPFPPFGRALAPWLIVAKLRKLFAYRHAVTKAWCEPL